MNRPFFVRLLLSLILLLSQQMATLHALEHLGGALDARGVIVETSAQVIDEASDEASDEANELAKAVAQHQSCHQCLAFAQLAAPMAATQVGFAPPQPITHGVDRARAGFHRSDSVHDFLARAPPLA